MLKHKHTGKLRPHYHTSYAGLFFMLLVAGVLLLGMSLAASAAVPAVNPQSGSVGLTGTVRGPAPSTAATILAPRNGSHTTTIPITISGTCPAGTFVNITKNATFGGATVCQDDGTFSLLVDLYDGQNTLLARVSDALGQFGPDSAPITVYYDAPSLNLPSGSIGKQLFLNMTTTVVGGSPGQPISRTVTIVGGIGAYAVSWDFGDDATSLSSVASEGPVTASHVYDRPGIYRVIVRVTDSSGNSAFLQFVTVVNGPVEALGSNRGTGLGALPGLLLTAWPLYVLAALMVLFFWLGERREVHKLRSKHRIIEY
jgi:hypothetical protein